MNTSSCASEKNSALEMYRLFRGPDRTRRQPHYPAIGLAGGFPVISVHRLRYHHQWIEQPRAKIGRPFSRTGRIALSAHPDCCDRRCAAHLHQHPRRLESHPPDAAALSGKTHPAGIAPYPNLRDHSSARTLRAVASPFALRLRLARTPPERTRPKGKLTLEKRRRARRTVANRRRVHLSYPSHRSLIHFIR